MFEDLVDDDERTRFYTGFPTFGVLHLFWTQLLAHGVDRLSYWRGADQQEQQQQQQPTKTKLRLCDQFLLTMMRLRLGLLQEFLGHLFFVSPSTISRIFTTWVSFLFDHCRGMIPWPTREQILCNLPNSFSDFQLVRIVIDCTEFFIERPGTLEGQFVTWSEYKHHSTCKLCIGCTPNGLIMFVSRLWGGRASDRHIVEHDGDSFIPLLEEDDIVLADKGFVIRDLLPPSVGLNYPPFIGKHRQMTEKEFFQTRDIAGPRIVIEMANERLKNFRILQGVFPMAQVHLLEQISVICCAITNLYEPILR